jgi:putative DNA primase/helicase
MSDATAIRQKLRDNGYSPVPAAGKAAVLRGWPELCTRQPHPAEIGRWGSDPFYQAAINTGLACSDAPGGLVAVDLDFLEPDLAEMAEALALEELGESPLVRIGQWPKRAMLFRNDGTVRTHRRKAADGSGNGVDVLAGGAMLIGHGVHPGTGGAYEWTGGGTPWDTPRDALPPISADAIHRLLERISDEVVPLATGGGGGRGRKGHRGGGGADIVRNEAGLVTDGREAFLARCVWDGVTEKSRTGTPDARDVAGVAWERFVKEVDLSRPRENGNPWGFDDALAKARAAVGKVLAAQLSARPAAPIGEADLSHDALAIELGARAWDRDARFVALWGKWLFWTGTHWEIDERLEHLTRVRAFLRERADELIAWAETEASRMEPTERSKAQKLRTWAAEQARTLRDKRTVVAVENLARANGGSVAGAETFDADPLILGTPGGVVDLRTGLLREARREDMVTKRTACGPAPGAPTRWRTFLEEVFGGDAELIGFMQRAAGYALTGETREHKMLFLFGGGRNGKSVFLDVLAHVWGDYGRRAPASAFITSHGEKHPTDIAGLQGRRLVVGSELPKGRTWDESVIKDLTGGERLTARFMRGDFFDFRPQMTLMIAGNTQPNFRGVDEAIRARVVLVPFNVTIPAERRDRHLADKLRDEAPQILQWAIEGALEWQRRGLDVPASVAAASADYFDQEDVVGLFLGDETVPVIGAFAAAGDLHLRFVQWCDAQGITPWAQHTLIKELRTRGFVDGKSNGRRGLKGLRLRQITDPR